MENLPKKITRLLNKANWTDDENAWLLRYLEQTNAVELRQMMQKQFEANRQAQVEVDPVLATAMMQELLSKIGVVQTIHRTPVINMRRCLLALGVVVIPLTAGLFLWFGHDTRKEMVQTPAQKKRPNIQAVPASNKVLLTMSDGQDVELDNNEAGNLADQGSSTLFFRDGKLVYRANTANNETILYNTVTTPAGTNYQVQLPDGSEVWLNAASSIHFPTAFTGPDRSVDITGEAYFEVAKNATKPFIVHVQGAEIRVAGTHFNVMAYANETAIKTTLLEGAVTFVNGDRKCLLKPGQQGQLVKGGSIKLVSDIDVAKIVAWKNGLFDFDGADIEMVARQLSRWYNVEMVFNNTIHNRFYGKIPNSTPLGDVLKALELTGKVRFTIKGNKINAMPAD